jgi:hypothetical protein
MDIPGVFVKYPTGIIIPEHGREPKAVLVDTGQPNLTKCEIPVKGNQFAYPIKGTAKASLFLEGRTDLSEKILFKLGIDL